MAKGDDDIRLNFAAFCRQAIKKGVLKKYVQEHCSVLPRDLLYPPQEDEMSFETSMLWISIYIVLFLVGVVILYVLQGIKPSRGRNVIAHVLYAIIATLVLIFHPHTFGDMVLSEFGVFIIGVAFPCFMSLKALMTPEGGDDTRWLMYWIVFSLFTVATEWVDLIVQYFDHWYEVVLAILVWFQLPFTDGLNLCYDFIVTPLMKPVFAKVEGLIENSTALFWVMVTAVNLSGLSVVLLVLFVMPDVMTSFIIIIVGVGYPVLASMTAISTKVQEYESSWLMYWVAFCLIRLALECAEELSPWLDVSSLHRMLLVAVVWLQLPLFKGAEKIFREVLVPIAGLQADLYIVDLRHTLMYASKLQPKSSRKVAEAAEKISEELLQKIDSSDAKKKK